MIKNLYDSLLQFLNNHGISEPFLLGFSGGPDSMALFHLLLMSKCPFHAAHIDHGWREESKKEADYLTSLCKERKIPFYLETLENGLSESNLEDICREKRLDFFRRIVTKNHLQGVMLAHHGDDQAETVLKRIFEGASLPKLGGLLPIAENKGLKIFRPLLGVAKKDLIEWLDKEGISYFHDCTNDDKRFLRTRLRHDIFPFLSQEFGKGVTKSLCRVGKNASELAGFLEELLIPYRKLAFQSGNMRILNLHSHPPQHIFLWKAVVKDFFQIMDISLSDSILETIVHHLQNESVHKSIRVSKKKVDIHRMTLSICEINDFN